MGNTKRLLALDVLRGMTVCMMMIVNNPGSWNHIYSPLKHSDWNGCTPTDLVYPFFLFCVGVSVYFSFKKNNHKLDYNSTRKIIIRMILIFLIGFLLNTYSWFVYNGGLDLSLTGSYFKVRIFGVLQRIGIAYGIGSLIVLGTKRAVGIFIGIGILLAYWTIMVWQGDLTLGGNFAKKVDLAILGDSHMYHGYKIDGKNIAFDPEGIFSTIPAIVSVMFSFYLGYTIDKLNNYKNKVFRLFYIGFCIVLFGLLWNMVYPINKPLWSSTYVVYSTGLATLILAILISILDIWKIRKWEIFFLPFGMNPLFMFVLSGVFVTTMSHIKFRNINLQGHIYKLLTNHFSEINASFIYALMFMSFMWIIAFILYKRKIYIKI